MLTKASQELKAHCPIEVTLLGIVMSVIYQQFSNALAPIVSSVLGRAIVVRAVL